MGHVLRDVFGNALQGQLLDVTVPNPAHGQDWSYTLQAGASWRLLLGYATLKTTAEAGERVPGFLIRDGDGHNRWGAVSAAHQATGITEDWCYAPFGGVEAVAQAGPHPLEVPPVWLPAGWSIGSSTKLLKAEDAWTGVRLLLEQAYDFDPAEAPGTVNGHDAHWSDWRIAHAA